MVVLIALLTPASIVAASSQPTYNVTIQATVSETIHTAQSCNWNLDETRHLIIQNAAPLRLTAAQLGKAKNGLFALVVKETRSAQLTLFPLGPNETLGPACRQPSSQACGTLTYKVPAIGTGVGFLPRTDKFTFYYTYIGPDPYQGGCGEGVVTTATSSGGKEKAWIDGFPQGTAELPTVTASAHKLQASKAFAVSGSTTYQSPPNLCGTPPCAVEDVHSVFEWRVTLVPAR